MSVLELEGIHRAFVEGQDVLRGVSLSVGAGEVVGLVGPNGAGKTTLLRIAMGMLHPRAGSVRVFGMDPWEEPVAVKRRVGYVSEDQVFPKELRTREIVALHRALFPTWDDAFAAELLATQGLDSGSQIGTLSKGQARRVALVCALAHRPELLILDEPAGGLDPAARRDFLEAAIGSMSRDGCTVVFSSHHMPDVERIAGRMVLMQHGAVVLDGSLDDCREGFALVIGGPALEPLLRATDGFMSLRRRGEAVHALVQATPEAARERLEDADAEVKPLVLEDLFIELVEGER